MRYRLHYFQFLAFIQDMLLARARSALIAHPLLDLKVILLLSLVLPFNLFYLCKHSGYYYVTLFLTCTEVQ